MQPSVALLPAMRLDRLCFVLLSTSSSPTFHLVIALLFTLFAHENGWIHFSRLSRDTREDTIANIHSFEEDYRAQSASQQHPPISSSQAACLRHLYWLLSLTSNLFLSNRFALTKFAAVSFITNSSSQATANHL